MGVQYNIPWHKSILKTKSKEYLDFYNPNYGSFLLNSWVDSTVQYGYRVREVPIQEGENSLARSSTMILLLSILSKLDEQYYDTVVSWDKEQSVMVKSKQRKQAQKITSFGSQKMMVGPMTTDTSTKKHAPMT